MHQLCYSYLAGNRLLRPRLLVVVILDGGDAVGGSSLAPLRAATVRRRFVELLTELREAFLHYCLLYREIFLRL